MQQAVTKQAAVQETMKKMEAIEFAPPIKDYPGEVAQVQLGAGSRKPVYLGGQQALYRFEEPQPHEPVVTFDVFDIPMPGLPRPIREHFSDVMEHPGDWAKKAVNDFEPTWLPYTSLELDPKLWTKHQDRLLKILKKSYRQWMFH